MCFVGDVALRLGLHVQLEFLQTQVDQSKSVWHLTIECLLSKSHVLLDKRFTVLLKWTELGFKRLNTCLLVFYNLIEPINLLIFVVHLLLQVHGVRHFFEILVMHILMVQILVLVLEIPLARMTKELWCNKATVWMTGSMMSVHFCNFMLLNYLLLI